MNQFLHRFSFSPGWLPLHSRETTESSWALVLRLLKMTLWSRRDKQHKGWWGGMQKSEPESRGVGWGEEHGQKDWGAMPMWVPFLLQPSTSHTLETDILGSWKPNTLTERFFSTGTLFFLFCFSFFFLNRVIHYRISNDRNFLNPLMNQWLNKFHIMEQLAAFLNWHSSDLSIEMGKYQMLREK